MNGEFTVNGITTNQSMRREVRLFYFTLIDIMFFPYIFHLPIKVSMITLIMWVFKNEKNRNKKFQTNLLIFAFIGGISVLYGLIKSQVSSSVIMTNVQTLVIIIYAYIAYEYVATTKRKYDIDLTNIFILYLSVAAAFMLLYWAKPTLFFQIRPFWTIQRTGEVFTSYANNRYTFLVSEPNNLSALVVAIMAYLFTEGSIEKKEVIGISVIIACIVVSTSSNSGMIYYVAIFFLCIVFRGKKARYPKQRSMGLYRKAFMYVAIAVVLVFVAVIIFNWDKVSQSDLFNTATNRYKLYINSQDVDYTGARSEVWKRMIQSHNIFEYLIIGDASIGKPHSGHLYIIYAFGMVMYVLFMRAFLLNFKRGRAAYFVRIVFLAVFTMNTLIVDLRAFVLFAVLLAATARNNEGNMKSRRKSVY